MRVRTASINCVSRGSQRPACHYYGRHRLAPVRYRPDECLRSGILRMSTFRYEES